MPNIEYNVNGSAITISGLTPGTAISIADANTATTAQVTSAGLFTKINNPSKIGLTAIQAIDGTERRLDLTALSGTAGYPMEVELESRDASCYIRQGSNSVALRAGILENVRILEDRWRRITVDSANEAYIAVKQTATTSGLLVGMRIDSLT